jgi:cysteine rich repeat protein
MSLKSTLVIAAVAIISGFAFAESTPLHEACRSDVKALCVSVQPGGGRIRDCMRDHRAELSNTCKLAIADRMLERRVSRSANGSSSAVSR